jgi:transaldolase/glucose-6-phosphate isomerase
LIEDVAGARRVMGDLAAVGISMDELTSRLLDDGVQLFADAYDKLIAAIGQRVRGGIAA